MEPVGVFIMLIFFLAIDAVLMVGWGLFMDSKGLEFCNPRWLYIEKQLCVFSCVFVTILANISTLPYALGYWLYKACTTRRK